ncbi:hypothetical protein LMG27952_07710 [Paraburkholderia hiiakae]|uniref:Uncharacterized protein n=1 Tax=Paraburkholderia hiiakae TaxID=1081782 RepID=A0ABM8PBP8_9BURK|nr:hypothetical protein LMG27952_07710 [Paraburkholderia hiiakae]
MKQRPRIYYSETQKALMWDRWRKGDMILRIVEDLDECLPGNEVSHSFAVGDPVPALRLGRLFGLEVALKYLERMLANKHLVQETFCRRFKNYQSYLCCVACSSCACSFSISSADNLRTIIQSLTQSSIFLVNC